VEHEEVEVNEKQVLQLSSIIVVTKREKWPKATQEKTFLHWLSREPSTSLHRFVSFAKKVFLRFCFIFYFIATCFPSFRDMKMITVLKPHGSFDMCYKACPFYDLLDFTKHIARNHIILKHQKFDQLLQRIWLSRCLVNIYNSKRLLSLFC